MGDAPFTDVDRTPELILVQVHDLTFALEVTAVREIRGWTAAVPLPNAPPSVLGIINLRGLVLPVVDLGRQLTGKSATPSPSSVVVVAVIGERHVGLLVDAVCDIITPSRDVLQPPPALAGRATAIQSVMISEVGIVAVLSLVDVLKDVTSVAAPQQAA